MKEYKRNCPSCGTEIKYKYQSEYYEKFHKYKKEYDIQRQKIIQKKLGCKFIIIHEEGDL